MVYVSNKTSTIAAVILLLYIIVCFLLDDIVFNLTLVIIGVIFYVLFRRLTENEK